MTEQTPTYLDDDDGTERIAREDRVYHRYHERVAAIVRQAFHDARFRRVRCVPPRERFLCSVAEQGVPMTKQPRTHFDGLREVRGKCGGHADANLVKGETSGAATHRRSKPSRRSPSTLSRSKRHRRQDRTIERGIAAMRGSSRIRRLPGSDSRDRRRTDSRTD